MDEDAGGKRCEERHGHNEFHLLAGSLQARANAEPDQSLFGAIRIRVRRSIPFDDPLACAVVQVSGGLSFKIGGGNVLTLCPPLTIPLDAFDEAFSIIEVAFSDRES